MPDSSSSVKTTSWGSLHWLASREVGNASDITLGRVVIKAGQSNPRHAHGNCEEVLYLLAGKLDHSLGDDNVMLAPGDTIVVRSGVFHNAVSLGPEDADMIVVYSTGQREFTPESDQ
ncbi:MAG TPA: cupin domain-containing protein [Phycisphaerae bacterium]|nr:cupin domain-containing protein [Phycisphaerae bacterium]